MKLTIQVIPQVRGGARYRAPSLSGYLDRVQVRAGQPTAAHPSTASAGDDGDATEAEAAAAALAAGVTIMIL